MKAATGRTSVLLMAILASIALAACASTPKGQAGRTALEDEAYATLQSMQAKDPSLVAKVANSYGYAVFPKIAQGGLIVGGATGEGVVYRQGEMIGFTTLNQASIGAQLGGQTFSELLLFEDPAALQRLTSGNFGFGADASAVAVDAGVAGSTPFKNGTAVFVMSQSGLMANLSVYGQQLSYTPATAVGGTGAQPK